MSNVEAIKKALEGVTPGPWHVEGKKYRGNFSVAWKPELKVCQTYGDSLAAENNATYIAAVNPVAITELLTTLEALQRENEIMRQSLSTFVAFFDKAMEGFTEGYAERNNGKIICGVNNAELPISAFISAKHALASAGEEHHADK